AGSSPVRLRWPDTRAWWVSSLARRRGHQRPWTWPAWGCASKADESGFQAIRCRGNPDLLSFLDGILGELVQRQRLVEQIGGRIARLLHEPIELRGGFRREIDEDPDGSGNPGGRNRTLGTPLHIVGVRWA